MIEDVVVIYDIWDTVKLGNDAACTCIIETSDGDVVKTTLKVICKTLQL